MKELRAIALHDLTYPESVLTGFFNLLSTYFNIVNLNNLSDKSFKPSILLTADDGYEDWLKFLPLLEKYNCSVILGVCSIFVDEEISPKVREHVLRNNLHRTKVGVENLTVDSFRALINSPRVHIADHTYDHPDLAKVSETSFRLQLEKSQEIFARFNIKPSDFIFPYGRSENLPSHFDYKSVLNDLGMKRAWTFTRSTYGGYFLLPRAGIDPSMGRLEILARIMSTKTFPISDISTYDI